MIPSGDEVRDSLLPAGRMLGDMLVDRLDAASDAARPVNRLVDGLLTWGGSALSEAVPIGGDRFSDAWHSTVTGPYDAAVGLYRDGVEGARDLRDAVRDAAHGDHAGAADALSDFANRPAKALVGGGAMALGSGLSAAQTFVGLEPPGRTLTAAESAALRTVFGDSIDYRQLRIKDGDAGVFSLPGPLPFVLGNTIFMKDYRDPDTLVHEMVHVWQHQNGGTDYIPEALGAQHREGDDAYTWQDSVPSVAWQDLQPEKQGELIKDAFHAGVFDRDPPVFTTRELRALGVGADKDQVDRYLTDAITQMREGRGAP